MLFRKYKKRPSLTGHVVYFVPVACAVVAVDTEFFAVSPYDQRPHVLGRTGVPNDCTGRSDPVRVAVTEGRYAPHVGILTTGCCRVAVSRSCIRSHFCVVCSQAMGGVVVDVVADFARHPPVCPVACVGKNHVAAAVHRVPPIAVTLFAAGVGRAYSPAGMEFVKLSVVTDDLLKFRAAGYVFVVGTGTVVGDIVVGRRYAPRQPGAVVAPCTVVPVYCGLSGEFCYRITVAEFTL